MCRHGSNGRGKSKRVVLFKGAKDPVTSTDGLPPTRDQLMECLDAIIPKRNIVVRRLMHGMDGMSEKIDKELTQLMLRKRALDSQDSAARQAISRQEIADTLAGRTGYVAERFLDKFGNRPFTAL